jgi:predicted transcriptional regulator
LNIDILIYGLLLLKGDLLKSEDIFEQYDTVKEDMKFFTSSDVRSKIIISLTNGSKNLANLRGELCLSSSTILHGMNQLEEKDFIFRESRYYSLSQTGEIAARILIDMMKSIYTLKKFKPLFLHHEIGCLPNHLLKDVGSLNDSEIVKSTNKDVLKPQRVLSDLLSETNSVKHLSSVFHPQNTVELLKTIENGGELQLVLTRGVLEQLIETTGMEIINKAVFTGQLQIRRIKDDTKISFTMGNDFVALGLFSTEGVYDLNMFMISQAIDAIAWGKNLFNYYLDQSEKFELKI